jgi:hypothetical protein
MSGALARVAGVLAALLFACLGLVVTVSAPANAACSCKQGQLQQQVNRADVIFRGTIDKVTTAGNDTTYDITASRSYKGAPARETQVVSTAGGRNDCGLGDLMISKEYVFLASGTEAPYAADQCGGTTLANPNKIGKVEAILGAGEAIEPPPPPTAVLTKVEDAPPAGLARTAAPGAAAAIIGLLGLVVVRRLARR